MQITLPDDSRVAARARAAGCASIEEYVRKLVEQDVAATTQHSGRLVTNEQWIRNFRAFVQSLPASNIDFDDSRESIYPVR